MNELSRHQLPNLILFIFTLTHALLTWNLTATTVLFAGGIGIAFVLELSAVKIGLLKHNLHPQIASVPLSVLLAWPSVVYISYRLALLITSEMIPAAGLTAVIATTADSATDPMMVEKGAWEYPETMVSQPRFRGVPWWNFVGWIGIVFAVALLPQLATS
jgi:uncharacterized membrane protein